MPLSEEQLLRRQQALQEQVSKEMSARGITSQMAFAELIGRSQSWLSRALNPKEPSEARLALLQEDLAKLHRRQENGASPGTLEAESAAYYVEVPVYGDASAGPGRIIRGEPTRYRSVSREEYFYDFQHAPNGGNFAYFRIKGDSAVPVYFDGEEVPVEVIPPGTQSFINDTTYIFRWREEAMIKRIRRLPDNTIHAFSLNPAVPVFEFKPIDEHEFEVLGRVIGGQKQQLYAAMVGRMFAIQQQVWDVIKGGPQ